VWAGERWLGGQAAGRGRAGEVAVGRGALWLGVVRRWRPGGPGVARWSVAGGRVGRGCRGRMGGIAAL